MDIARHFVTARLTRGHEALCCLAFALVLGGTFAFGGRIGSKRTAATAAARKQINKKRKHCPKEEFQAGCDLPFKGEIIHEIDQRCPRGGLCTVGAGTKLQNQIKNNFCAQGKPIEIGIETLDRLQHDVDEMVAHRELTYGRKLVPPKPKDRPKLKSLPSVDVHGDNITLGEGDVVIFEGVVIEARHDDSFPLGFSGETVNCNNPALNWNDIHIVLGETISTPDCSSVTAEIIPHLRPAVWDRFDSNPITSKFVQHPLPVKGLRVRLTGQLFFDGSHIPKPCREPKRRTSWEIHPVYGIAVFDKSLKQFVSLETWASDK